ncbi:MAG: efflux RND transporter periplasmic adaptor subunit [Alphaproteobacteria bacterium]|nr:efflux RND transporter periplasmic adaptor subunit [Alphaproteobacteria bacterium]
MRKASFLIVVLAIFLGMTAVVAFRTLTAEEEQSGGWRGGALPVMAFEVSDVEFADIVEALGTARANETVVVTARVSDTISRINFESGQRVEAGDILVELTDTEEAADLAEARATLREAQADQERANDLIERGVVTRQRLDEANAAVARAGARVSSIEAQLADRIVRAPFSGVVGLREVSVGGLVRPADPIATLDDTSVVKLDFTVPERFVSAIEPGLPVLATTSAYPDDVFDGLIAQIDSRIDPVTRSVTVRAEIDNADGRLRPGQLMGVEIRRDIRSNPAIPGSAIVRFLEDTYVFVIEEGERGTAARQVSVELGRRSGDLIEVVSGLEAGQEIVGQGVHRVRDRMPVNVTEREGGPGAGGGAPAGIGGASPQ